MMELSRSFNKRLAAIAITASFAIACPAAAVELLHQDDVTVRWDNTIQYSTALRLNTPELALITSPNADDGDRNFHQGFVSHRFDILSELDVAFAHWGVAASAAAWYDTIYNAKPDSSPTPASFYPLPSNFAPAVQRLHGRDIELLNGFVYANEEIGGTPVSLRAGRHALLWGESLFFAGNGIAAGQAPIDSIKALSVPLARAKEVYMPVAQASGNVQIAPGFVLEGYYQFEWRRSRSPGSGSYFSAADFVDAGGAKLYVGRNQYLLRAADDEASQTGQYGVALRIMRGDSDFGFYALRFHAKEPVLYFHAGAVASANTLEKPQAYGTGGGIFAGPSNPLQILDPSLFGTNTGVVGNYRLVFPEGIQIYGASFSGYLGDSNVATEISVRRRMPLVSTALIETAGLSADGNDHPLYARGDTLHGQMSIITAFAPSRFWSAANFSAEFAANQRLNVTANKSALDPTRTRFAASMRGQFEPAYFAVLPGVDISLPMSIGYAVTGRSSVDAGQIAGAGSFEFGISATYRVVWKGFLGVTYFIGGPTKQPFADRNFVSFNLRRTF